jgi:hypothetical protein
MDPDGNLSDISARHDDIELLPTARREESRKRRLSWSMLSCIVALCIVALCLAPASGGAGR